MKKINQSLEDKLLDYVDGTLHEKERADIDHLLQKDLSLKARLDELKELNTSLLHFNVDQPSKNFTQGVMGGLDNYPLTKSFTIRNSVLLLAGIIVTVGLASLLVAFGVFDGTTTVIDLNQIDMPKKYIPTTIPSIPFNGKVLMNILIFLNVMLVLIVFDKAVLNPFFQRRMKEG